MRATTLEEFRAELLATGAYRTPDARRGARAKPGAWTTFRYSWNVATPFRLCGIYESLKLLDVPRWAEFCFRTVTCAEALGMNVILEGWENRQAHKGPVVYLCNHMSMTETILLPPIVLAYGGFNVVAKASLAHLPLLEKAAQHMGMIPLGRTSPRQDLVTLLRVGCEKIAGGNSFLIFPQGTRQRVFSRAKYSSIGAKLAERAGCPVCPIVVDTRCQPTREKGLLKGILKDFGPVDPARDIRCACGPVLPPGKARDMHEAAFDWMASKLESWGLPTERQASAPSGS